MLLCRAAGRVCALPVEHVVETMRPLPVEPIAGAPGFVRGVSVVRGEPVPVVSLAALLAGGGEKASRLVTVRTDTGPVALAVAEVSGVRALAPEALRALPPLLSGALGATVSAIGSLDAGLLVVLRAARLLPDEVRAAIEGAAHSP